MQRKSVEGVRERAEFPGADVAGEIENAFAAALAFEEIFMAVEDDVPLDVFFCVAREARKFGGHPSKIAQHAAGDCCSVRGGPVGKSDAQIEFGGLAQFWKQSVRKPRDGRAKRA